MTQRMAPLPVLAVVGGPMGAGKTTLAHRLARAVGCPAICRDEIKEGMVQASPGFVAAPGDDLTRRTLPVFFDVLELLLRAGVTTVAEAARARGDRGVRHRLTPVLKCWPYRTGSGPVISSPWLNRGGLLCRPSRCVRSAAATGNS